MMNELIKQIELHVTNLLLTKLPLGMIYHNISHTRMMVAAVTELTEQMLFNEWEKYILQASAWFHDSGYCYGYEGHESISMTLAGEFLRAHGMREIFINPVYDCIRATKMPHAPTTAMQWVMCDADMRHLSLTNYQEQSDLLRAEWAVKLKKEYSDQDWDRQNLQFLNSHHYFTAPAKKLWNPQKLENRRLLELKIDGQ